MAKLNCEKVLYLLPLYIEGKIDNCQNDDIEQHLSDCSNCFEKYIIFKNISQKIKKFYEKISKSKSEELQKQFFEDNLSAFIDNELSKEDYYIFLRYISLNPDAKKELDKMTVFEQKIKDSFEKNKKFLDTDLSKTIVNQIKTEKPSYVYGLYVKAVFLTIALLVISIFAGYFSVPENWQNFVFKAHLDKTFHR